MLWTYTLTINDYRRRSKEEKKNCYKTSITILEKNKKKKKKTKIKINKKKKKKKSKLKKTSKTGQETKIIKRKNKKNYV